MNAKHRCSDGGPCRVPPHPDVQAQIAAERLQRQSVLSPDSSVRDATRLSAPTGTIPGLNDGTIFPESHFEATPSPSELSRAALERAPLRGPIRAAIVLVDTSDKPMAAGAAERFRDLFFSTGKIATGSVTEYYASVSGGKISLLGEVVGPFRMPLKMTEYAHGDYGFANDFPNTRTLAANALAAADGQINFKPYDNDGNGYVDAFVVVHAGQGGEQTQNKNDLWSAKWVLPNVTPVDTVNVYAFLTIPEDAYIGVCAHELGHLLFGWPDLYDTDYSSQGVGNWCLMSGGTWGGSPAGTTPCHPSVWCKVNQGWVNVVTETANRSITLPDVEGSHEVHRLWKSGDTASTEYFLLENRQQVGFDKSLPGAGLLVWHIDDSKDNNTDEKHYKVSLMQADGRNQLANASAGRGDAGDPFPGSSNNTSFSSASNPNSLSYAGQDTSVSISKISASAQTMRMDLTVQPVSPTTLTPIYRQGDPGNGIGGYDLRSQVDLAFAFDYNSSGNMGHLVLYRPGTGTCWILANENGSFRPVYKQGDPGNGIGGYDLRSAADRGLAFDYESSGKLDHLIFYRPGHGAIFIIKNSDGSFTSVYAQGGNGRGIGGYDLKSPADKAFALDYNSSGKQDHLCLYRPGTGTMWILRHDGGNFVPVYRQGDPGQGIGGYDLKSPADRAFAFDWERSGKMDHIALYRPGTGTFWCLRNAGGTFQAVMSEGDPGRGVGGYDLKNSADVAFAFDWTSSGKKDHVALYRPGTGTFWVLEHTDGGFRAVLSSSKGIGGYDLRSPADKAFAFDYDHSGKFNYLVLYRTNATGTIWILKRS